MVVFYRCLLASLLPDSVKKVLYLDSDILVLKPLGDFWNTNLEGKALAGVPDDFTVNPVHCNRLGYDLSYNYFNGDVLIIELDYCGSIISSSNVRLIIKIIRSVCYITIRIY